MIIIENDNTKIYAGQKYLRPKLGLLFDAATKQINPFVQQYRTNCSFGCLGARLNPLVLPLPPNEK
jgi:hypothetical protein